MKTFKEKQPRFQTLENKFENKRENKWENKENRRERGYESNRGERADFSRSRSDNGKPRFAKDPQKSTAYTYPSEGKKANGEGKVKIMVKGGNPWESGEKVKKTGALSPRAPEKIKKNRAEEMKIYGENACLTLFQQRPESIVRLWATIEGAKKLGEMTSYLAANKKAYHVVDRAEMEKVTGTEHHGEMCLLVKKAPAFTLEGYLQIPRKQDCLVLLDCVNNAQNIGGIIRTCAFYGVKGVVVESADTLNSSAAARVAEGGLEFVHPLETKHKEIALKQLREAGYQVVQLTRQKQAKTLAQTALQAKVVFVLSEIVGTDVDNRDTAVQLSFANSLNSGLNVAVNAGILLNQWYQSQVL